MQVGLSAPHLTFVSAVSSRRCTAAWGENPWASRRATAPVTWGAAIDVPASQPYWFCLSFCQYVDQILWVSSPSAAPPGASAWWPGRSSPVASSTGGRSGHPM